MDKLSGVSDQIADYLQARSYYAIVKSSKANRDNYKTTHRDLVMSERRKVERIADRPLDELWNLIESPNTFVHIARSGYADDMDILKALYCKYIEIRDIIVELQKDLQKEPGYNGMRFRGELLYYVFASLHRGRESYYEITDNTTSNERMHQIIRWCTFPRYDGRDDPVLSALELFLFRLNRNSQQMPTITGKFRLPSDLRVGDGHHPEMFSIINLMVNGANIVPTSEDDVRFTIYPKECIFEVSKDIFFAEILPILREADPYSPIVPELFSFFISNEKLYTETYYRPNSMTIYDLPDHYARHNYGIVGIRGDHASRYVYAPNPLI